ncbi:hypothetical protein NQ317_013910, partial [Molorchus minor]
SPLPLEMSGKIKSRWLFVLACYVVFTSKKSNAFVLDNLLGDDRSVEDVLELFIPTIRTSSQKCLNHSRYYLKELKNYTLWATQNVFNVENSGFLNNRYKLVLVFDATTKFPNGFLYGAAYDFGNFDECLELRIPYDNEEFSGKYCMAKFVFDSNKKESISKTLYDYEFSDYTKYYNISMWKMIYDYMQTPMRNPRNEFRFAYCMPSSCSADDLENALEEIVKNVTENSKFRINVEVDRRTCQISKPIRLTYGDCIFIFSIGFIILTVITASLYDVVTRRDDFEQYRLTGKVHDVIVSFSFPRNFRKLTTVSSDFNSMGCLAGMKVYSMILVILLHRDMFDYGSALDNPKPVEQHFSRFELTFILNGPILVDTFFTISGFLATFLILQKYHRTQRGINIAHLYIHRYIRMTSVYCVILAFYCTLFAKLGNGPLWQERVGFEREKCRNSWWANLLYINNYFDTENYCMFQSWYMACDMYGFIFVPVLCWIVWKKSSAGLIAIISAIIGSAITVFAVVYVNNELPILVLHIRSLLVPNTMSTFLKVYIPGYMRVSSYFVGVLAGYLKHKMEINDFKIPKHWIYGGMGDMLPADVYRHACIIRLLCVHITSLVFCFVRLLASYRMEHGHILDNSCHIVWIRVLGKPNAVLEASGNTKPTNLYRLSVSWYDTTVFFWDHQESGICQHFRFEATGTLGKDRIMVFALGNHFGNLKSWLSIRTCLLFIHKFASDVFLGFLLAFILTMFFESPIIGLEKNYFF